MISAFECNFTSSYLPIPMGDGLKLVFWTCSAFLFLRLYISINTCDPRIHAENIKGPREFWG